MVTDLTQAEYVILDVSFGENIFRMPISFDSRHLLSFYRIQLGRYVGSAVKNMMGGKVHKVQATARCFGRTDKVLTTLGCKMFTKWRMEESSISR